MILCGDWNELPDSATYSLLTTGRADIKVIVDDYSGQHPPRPIAVANALGPLGSAYAVTHAGEEPQFTCATARFSGTLDYMFFTQGSTCSGGTDGCQTKCQARKGRHGWTVLRCPSLPPLPFAKRTNGLPNARWPSDHLALAAEFCVKRVQRCDKRSSKLHTAKRARASQVCDAPAGCGSGMGQGAAGSRPSNDSKRDAVRASST